MFPTVGFEEMLLLMVVGLLLYGRDLPAVGRKLGMVLAQLRRSMQQFKDELDRNADLQDVKKTMHGAVEDLRRVTEVPRAVADPGRMLRDLTNEALASPAPPAATSSSAPPVPEPLPDQPRPPEAPAV